jgi:hypothetical protein
MKADKCYVYRGAIYLKGAEMPAGWTPPKNKNKSPGVLMIGPEGRVETLPAPALPENVAPPAPSLDALAIEDLRKIAEERGVEHKGMKQPELVKALSGKE